MKDTGFFMPEDKSAAKAATSHTLKSNAEVQASLPFHDRRSFDNAARGFIATINPLTINKPQGGRTVFDLSRVDFLHADAPDTVNPSLWRQAQLNAHHNGLYEVVDGVYQVRSFDIANMTLIRGDSGWIIVDPLTSSETAAAALHLANEHLGERPVVAVLHTHSHADHFAGVLGVVSAEDVESGKIVVIAPQHYVDEALSENVLVGNVMNRRATYMYGNLLPASITGFVTTGLGAALSMGTTGFVVPNDIITQTGETRTIDGIEFVFQMTPHSEAPAEFIFYLPQFKALCTSEITSHHLHNVYTPRGAQVRDALIWSSQINEAIDLFGNLLEVQFACHHWPIWGRCEAVEFLKKQRDLYKYIHDQTLRLANKGFNKEEIAEQLRLPESLAKDFSLRGYYGTVHHNARAVYVKYLGYFDGNPATLHPLPPTQVAERYLEFMGGEDVVVDKAQRSFEQGDYRWVAEVVNHVVMANPANVAARALLADTYEQLGYQSESAPWRNFYLSGALELRQDIPGSAQFNASEGMARGMPLANLFQAMAVRLIGPKAADIVLHLNLSFPDLAQKYLLTIENAVLHVFADRSAASPHATLEVASVDFKRLMLGVTDAETLLSEQRLTIDGDALALAKLTDLFDSFERRFPIVTPRSF